MAHEHQAGDRQLWRDNFPVIFYIHRSFSSIILFTNLWLAWKLHQLKPAAEGLRRFAYALTGLVMVAILMGISLDRLGMPPIAQPIHMLMANLIFGSQFVIFICLNYAVKRQGK